MSKQVAAKPSVEQVSRILNRIMTLPDKGNIPYAKAYAEAARGMTGTALDVQVLYVLCNLSHWIGEEARASKKILKSFTGA